MTPGSHLRPGAGRISAHVLNVYIRSMGGAFRFSLLMALFVCVEAGRVCATVWLSTWTDTTDNAGGAPHPAIWYLTIYASISGVQARARPRLRRLPVVLNRGISVHIHYATCRQHGQGAARPSHRPLSLEAAADRGGTAARACLFLVRGSVAPA